MNVTHAQFLLDILNNPNLIYYDNITIMELTFKKEVKFGWSQNTCKHKILKERNDVLRTTLLYVTTMWILDRCDWRMAFDYIRTES